MKLNGVWRRLKKRGCTLGPRGPEGPCGPASPMTPCGWVGGLVGG